MAPAKIGKPPFDSLSASIADEIFTGCVLYEMKFDRWPTSSAEIEAGLDGPAKFLSKSYITLKEEADVLTVRYMVPSGAVWDMVFRPRKPKAPNKAPEPTPTSVTPRASSRSLDLKPWSAAPHPARGAPAVVVAHL
jgi:hypothetical protein